MLSETDGVRLSPYFKPFKKLTQVSMVICPPQPVERASIRRERIMYENTDYGLIFPVLNSIVLTIFHGLSSTVI